MSLRTASTTFAVALLAAACAVDADAQQPPKASAKAPQAASRKQAAKTPQASPQEAAPAGGLVVFIDPATGKLRQPNAAEIGTLSSTPATSNAGGAASPARPPTIIHGPGGAIGMTLGEDSHSYMVVTKTPDGKLAEDCVTGDKAAAALVSKGVTPKTTPAANRVQGVSNDK